MGAPVGGSPGSPIPYHEPKKPEPTHSDDLFVISEEGRGSSSKSEEPWLPPGVKPGGVVKSTPQDEFVKRRNELKIKFYKTVYPTDQRCKEINDQIKIMDFTIHANLEKIEICKQKIKEIKTNSNISKKEKESLIEGINKQIKDSETGIANLKTQISKRRGEIRKVAELYVEKQLSYL